MAEVVVCPLINLLVVTAIGLLGSTTLVSAPDHGRCDVPPDCSDHRYSPSEHRLVVNGCDESHREVVRCDFGGYDQRWQTYRKQLEPA